MSERKSISKHISLKTQFDTFSKYKYKNRFITRFMIPFDIKCEICKQTIHKGTKMSGLKEDITQKIFKGLDYYRIYFKCRNCTKTISIKTRSSNSYYDTELNCIRI